jgi:hypothetical protein
MDGCGRIARKPSDDASIAAVSLHRRKPARSAITGREQMQQTASSEDALFDHLVGEREQVIGDFDAKLLRSLQIDEKLKLGRL